MATTLERSNGPSSALWWELALGIEGRADARMGRKHQGLLAPLVAARVRWVRARGGEPTVPEWADLAVLSGLLAGPLGDDQALTECWLVRDAASGCLLFQAEPAGPRQSPLGGSLLLDAGGAQVQVGEGDHAARQWVWTGALPVALALLDAPASIRVETAREVVTVAAVRRPLGALEWGCDNQGIAVRSASLGGREMRWPGEALRGVRMPEGSEEVSVWALEADAAVTPDLPLASGGTVEFGMDARFGVYADLHIATRRDSATQRLRWIEPGSFLMGSPEDEPERFDGEGPQHQVTLTEGFWLADTACTQALWQAVMGANPSHFTGDPERPVEEVSWRDVQGFLRKLEALVPGCRSALPTEAQWEYACRAGTDTAFSFGDRITPEQVNYDGNYPYAGGEKGLDRGETVPVKSLPPNPWGLYEMHGNVWEWCADGQREYDSEPREDPTGPVLEAEGMPRVVRGGSWIFNARGARSAFRTPWPPGHRGRYQGFRLSLRSIEPGQDPVAERLRPGGPTGTAPGGRSGPEETPTRDESGLRKVLKALIPKGLRPDRKT